MAAAVDTSSSYSNLPGPGKDISKTNVTQQDLKQRKYLTWDSSNVEVIPPNEAEDIDEVANLLNQSQKLQFDKHRHCFGGTHARTHGIVKGTFVVPDDLPPHLKQSELFKQGGSYPAACRYSTEPGDPGFDDRVPAPRGFAMKLFNVPGEFYPDGEALHQQDIEFNNTPALELADAKTTREIIGLRIKYRDDPEGLKKEIAARKDAELQQGRDKVRNTHLAGMRLYSQTAYRFGSYVMKYSLVPSTETQRKLFDETVKPDEHESDVLHGWLRAFHATHDAEYEFQVQLLEDMDEQPVEYVGTPWDPEKFPWQTVGWLRVPKQESWDLERKSFWEDHMRVDPWLGLKSLQPLGSANRLRRVVYPRSSALRRKMNGRKEIRIKSIDEIPN